MAIYPFVKSPVSAFTDRSIGLRAAFGAGGVALEAAILALEDEGELVGVAETFLRARSPERDENLGVIAGIIDRVIADREITKVDDIVERCNLNKRTMQRLFSRYVGVGPKWVIKRYRLHEAAEQAAGGAVDWPTLALDLGYFDQAHFIRDFKMIVGKAPADYAQSLDTGF
ncbi:MAG TPA: AraC family transcriptional regulator [Chloroflexota bacterium]|nr:AraC family transcriptional regulator [Chloroflexota bacterium]